MRSKHRVLIWDGPGFSSSHILRHHLIQMGHEVDTKFLGFHPSTQKIDIQNYTEIVIRGPFSPTLSELVYSRVLAKQFQKTLHSSPTTWGPRVFCLGRGFLIALLADWIPQLGFDKIDWEALHPLPSYLKGRIRLFDQVKAEDSIEPEAQSFLMKSMSTHLAKIPSRHPLFSPWLISNDLTLGWQHNHRLYFSQFDPMSALQSTQNPNYGYVDRSDILSAVQIISQILFGKVFLEESHDLI